MSMKGIPWGAAMLVFAMALVSLGGCVRTSATVDYGPGGPPVSSETLKRIEPGETSRAWIIATLGEPTRAEVLDEGGEILVYEYGKREVAEFRFAPFWSSDATSQKRQRIYFEIADGVVRDYWTDKGQ